MSCGTSNNGDDGTVSVAISPNETRLTPGESAAFTATVTGTSDTSVTWSVSPAGCGTLPTTGNPVTYTAPDTVGTCTITATSTARPNASASATVTVTAEDASAAISAGHGFSLALDSTSNAWAWGRGNQGQLGNGDTAMQTTPVAVTMPTDKAMHSGRR